MQVSVIPIEALEATYNERCDESTIEFCGEH